MLFLGDVTLFGEALLLMLLDFRSFWEGKREFLDEAEALRAMSVRLLESWSEALDALWIKAGDWTLEWGVFFLSTLCSCFST